MVLTKFQASIFHPYVLINCVRINVVQISAPSLRKGGKVLRTEFLRSSRVYHPEDLPLDVKTVFTGWFKAIFDSSSEGIDDTILR